MRTLRTLRFIGLSGPARAAGRGFTTPTGHWFAQGGDNQLQEQEGASEVAFVARSDLLDYLNAMRDS